MTTNSKAVKNESKKAAEVIKNDKEVKEVEKIMGEVSEKVKENKNVVTVGNGENKVSYEIDNKKVKEIIKSCEGNKSEMIRKLKKEFNMRNSGIKKILMGEGIMVRDQMISNVVINWKEKEEASKENKE